MTAKFSPSVSLDTVVLTILLSVVSLEDASAVLYEGQFELAVTHGPPLVTPFTGTFQFDTEGPRTYYLNGGFFRMPVLSATLTGGDSSEGGQYVLDPDTATPVIDYRASGEPLALPLTFRNAVLDRKGYP